MNPRLEPLTLELSQKGWSLLTDIIPSDIFKELRDEALELNANEEFRRARIGPTDEELLRPDIRRDFIFWLKPEELSPIQAHLYAIMNELMIELSKRLFLSLRDFEAHYALYPNGGFYAKHVDQFQADCLRQLSIVLYLNEEWSEKDGGQLRIYNEKNPEVVEAEILPRLGTGVIFLSPSIYHEVLPTSKARVSLAGWMRKEVFTT